MASAAYDAEAGMLFGGSPSGLVQAVSARTGDPAWTFRASGGVYSSRAVIGNPLCQERRIGGASHPRLRPRNRGAGAPQKRVATEQRADSPPPDLTTAPRRALDVAKRFFRVAKRHATSICRTIAIPDGYT
jgi:hypothetical protein